VKFEEKNHYEGVLVSVKAYEKYW